VKKTSAVSVGPVVPVDKYRRADFIAPLSGIISPGGSTQIHAGADRHRRSRAVTRFVRRYPKVRVDLQLLDRISNLVEEGFDAAVRIGELADSTLVAQRLGCFRRLVVASPAYLRRVGVPRHPRDLLKGNCLRLSGTTPPWWVFHQGSKRITVPVEGNLTFNHVVPVVEACAAGLGFGMLYSYQAAAYLASGGLKAVLEDFEPAPRPLSLVYPSAQLLPSRTRVLLEWMRHELVSALQ